MTFSTLDLVKFVWFYLTILSNIQGDLFCLFVGELLFYSFSHVSQIATNQLISATSKDLKKLNTLVRRMEKQQKLQVEKLNENFTEALERYSNMQQVRGI